MDRSFFSVSVPDATHNHSEGCFGNRGSYLQLKDPVSFQKQPLDHHTATFPAPGQFFLFLLPMHKVGKKILLLLAVVTVVAHSIFPHIHLDDIVAMVNLHHHHESPADGHHSHDAGSNQGNQHNVFSFAQLDEDFMPTNGRFKKFDLPIQYLSPVISYLPETFLSFIDQAFGQYNEHPPPGYFGYNLPSRGPPVPPLS